MPADEHVNGAQFSYPRDMASATENERYTFGRAHRAYGAGDAAVLFGEGQQTTAPWPRAGKTKKGRSYDQDVVNKALASPPQLEDYDPRDLHATQPHIMRQHVNYYMGDEYHNTGRTAADQSSLGNQYPAVYHAPDGKQLLLSGHHRAASALLRGEPLRARPIRPS